jgi:hypothetical protein
MGGEPPDEAARVLQVVAPLLEIGGVHEVPDELQICHHTALFTNLTNCITSQ